METKYEPEYESLSKHIQIFKEDEIKLIYDRHSETLKKAFPGNDFFKIDKDKLNQPYKISLTRTRCVKKNLNDYLHEYSNESHA